MKKIAMLALVAVVALMASQPAVAGVGGCRPNCGWALDSNNPLEDARTPSLVDRLNNVLSTEMVAFLRVVFDNSPVQDAGTLEQQPGDLTTQGVGGCYRLTGCGPCGVGGC